jgi:hypothetical protein
MWECPLKEAPINFAVHLFDYSNKQALGISDTPRFVRVNKVS